MPYFFSFQNSAELQAALSDPHVTYNHAGTSLPIKLLENHYHSTFPLDAPIVLAWSRFIHEKNFPKLLASYKGFAIINDGLDGVLPKPKIYGICKQKGWPYIKQQQMRPQHLLQYENRYNVTHLAYYTWFRLRYGSNLQHSPYSPTRQAIWYAGEFPTEPDRQRPIDLLFIGYKNQHRKKTLELYQDIAKQLNLNVIITDEKYPPDKYFQLMTQAKICLSFVGSGPRARREWEIMLAGALLLNDAYLKQIWGGELPLMKDNEHFLWQQVEDRLGQIKRLLTDTEYRLTIAREGHKLAHTCFFQTPTIELRLIHALICNHDFEWNGTLSSIMALEKQYNLSWPQVPIRSPLEETE